MKFVKLKTKELYLRLIFQLMKLFTMDIHVNNSEIAIHVYQN